MGAAESRRRQVAGDILLGKHHLHSSDMGAAESRRNHSPFEGGGRVAVIGSGCREHALVKALLQDKRAKKVYIVPQKVDIGADSLPAHCLHDQQALLKELLKNKVDLVIIGPEKPLVEGLGDFLRKNGLKVFGPSAKAAQLEGSKIFAKQFMKKYSIPTASYRVIRSVKQTLTAAQLFSPPYVLKADGLAGGKGVFICSDKNELKQKAKALFEQDVLGTAGRKALLEEFQPGREISVFVITNGKSYRVLPIARDYKQLHESGHGPNTGGMGAHAPIQIPVPLMKKIEKTIIQPTMRGLKRDNMFYLGVLYFGLMVNRNGDPKVLEYNIRFGDPEAQVLFPLLKNSWLDLFYKVAARQPLPLLKWKKQHVACVVLASAGYPDQKMKSVPIKGPVNHTSHSNYFLKGSVIYKKNKWMTNGGRVLNAVALGRSQKSAIDRVYQQVRKISWSGMHYRRDIGSLRKK